MGLAVAAVVYEPEDDVEAVLMAAVTLLGRAGRRVAGLVQRFGPEIAAGKRSMFLDILPDGGRIRLHDPRGPGMLGCVLDSDALVRGAMAFRAAAESRPDVLLASRFGRQEAAGGGLRAEIAEAMLAGVPMLVPLRREVLPAWQAFLGEPGVVLAPTVEAICGWAGVTLVDAA